jgi:hypothetical protein
MNIWQFLNSQSDDRLTCYAIVFVVVVIAITNMFAQIFKKKDKDK